MCKWGLVGWGGVGGHLGRCHRTRGLASLNEIELRAHKAHVAAGFGFLRHLAGWRRIPSAATAPTAGAFFGWGGTVGRLGAQGIM